MTPEVDNTIWLQVKHVRDTPTQRYNTWYSWHVKVDETTFEARGFEEGILETLDKATNQTTISWFDIPRRLRRNQRLWGRTHHQ